MDWVEYPGLLWFAPAGLESRGLPVSLCSLDKSEVSRQKQLQSSSLIAIQQLLVNLYLYFSKGLGHTTVMQCQ